MNKFQEKKQDSVNQTKLTVNQLLSSMPQFVENHPDYVYPSHHNHHNHHHMHLINHQLYDTIDLSNLFHEQNDMFVNEIQSNPIHSIEASSIMPSLNEYVTFSSHNGYTEMDFKMSPQENCENLVYKPGSSHHAITSSPDNCAEANTFVYNSPVGSTSHSNESNENNYYLINKNGKRRKLSNSPCSSPASEIKTEEYQDESKEYKAFSFHNWKKENWSEVYDSNYLKIDPPDFKVEADKGFFFSKFDDSYVCQKKNHFQITTHTTLKQEPTYCRVNGIFYSIEKIQLQIYGMKMESHLQKIEIKQSDTDRKQFDYEPIGVRFKPNKTIRTTKIRLHFSHTTSNNNRKKNQPNPDQRYFLLVVEMQIVLKDNPIDKPLILCSSVSEKVIVRAVNPGQFKNQEATPNNNNNNNNSNSNSNITSPNVSLNFDVMSVKEALINENSNLSGSTASVNSSITQLALKVVDKNVALMGNMGIQTQNLDEALNVNGNIRLTGKIFQPSDQRVKQNIKEIDPALALNNISKLKLYQYDYKPEFVDLNGGIVSDYGIMAQELREVIPDAVVESGNIVLENGDLVENFLHVNKNRLHMECVGAVIALSDKTQNLDDKIIDIEKILVDPFNKKRIFKTQISRRRSSSYFSSTDRPNKMSECIKTRLFKCLVSFCLLTMTLAIAGILTVQIIQHLRSDSKENKNSSKKIFPLGFNYPPMMGLDTPNYISNLNCNISESCSFCCDDKTINNLNSKATNSLRPVVLEKKNLFNENITYVDKQNKYTPVFQITLFSNTSAFNLNLSIQDSCESSFCEEIDGDKYFYMPIDTNVPINLNPFYLIFYFKADYNITYCENQDTDNLCSESVENYNNDNISQMLQVFNQQYTQGTTTSSIDLIQLVYYVPITNFLHTDFKFRLTHNKLHLDSSDQMICSLTNKTYKDYVFRFYRNCND